MVWLASGARRRWQCWQSLEEDCRLLLCVTKHNGIQLVLHCRGVLQCSYCVAELHIGVHVLMAHAKTMHLCHTRGVKPLHRFSLLMMAFLEPPSTFLCAIIVSKHTTSIENYPKTIALSSAFSMSCLHFCIVFPDWMVLRELCAILVCHPPFEISMHLSCNFYLPGMNYHFQFSPCLPLVVPYCVYPVVVTLGPELGQTHEKRVLFCRFYVGGRALRPA